MNDLVELGKLYEDHQGIIGKLAHQYSRNGLIDYDELFSLGSYYFMKIAENWEPALGKFSTLLFTALARHFQTQIESRSLRPILIDKFEEFASNRHAKEYRAMEDKVSQMFNSASGDARYIYRLLYESPELALGQNFEADYERGAYKNQAKQKLSKYLETKRKWCPNRIRRAFLEMREVLQK